MDIKSFKQLEKNEIRNAAQQGADLLETYRYLDQVQEITLIHLPEKGDVSVNNKLDEKWGPKSKDDENQ